MNKVPVVAGQFRRWEIKEWANQGRTLPFRLNIGSPPFSKQPTIKGIMMLDFNELAQWFFLGFTTVGVIRLMWKKYN